MALTRTNHGRWTATPTHGTGAFTTGSFTSANNSLLVAICHINQNAGSTDPSGDLTISDSAALEWTPRVNIGNAASWSIGSRVWTAPVTSGASMTVSVDCGARSAENYFVDVLGYTGYDTGTPTGATATDSAMATDGADSITLSGAPASDSEVVATIFFDLGGAGTASVVAGTGWTEIYDSMGSDNYTLGQTQARTGSTSTAVDWNDVFDGTGTPAKAIALALEIKASGGAASIVPQAMAQYINQVIQ